MWECETNEKGYKYHKKTDTGEEREGKRDAEGERKREEETE